MPDLTSSSSNQTLCPSCQRPAQPGATFCGNCGAQLQASQQPTAPPPAPPTRCPTCGMVLAPPYNACSRCGIIRQDAGYRPQQPYYQGQQYYAGQPYSQPVGNGKSTIAIIWSILAVLMCPIIFGYIAIRYAKAARELNEPLAETAYKIAAASIPVGITVGVISYNCFGHH